MVLLVYLDIPRSTKNVTLDQIFFMLFGFHRLDQIRLRSAKLIWSVWNLIEWIWSVWNPVNILIFCFPVKCLTSFINLIANYISFFSPSFFISSYILFFAWYCFTFIILIFYWGYRLQVCFFSDFNIWLINSDTY